MSAPSTMRWTISSVPESKPSPRRAAPSRDRTSGSTTMKPAPRKAPRRVPSPPMMTMNRIWNERSRLNPAGSTVRR